MQAFKAMKLMLTRPCSQPLRLAHCLWAVAFCTGFVAFLFNLGYFLVDQGLPPWSLIVLNSAIALSPLMWVVVAKNSRLCLIILTLCILLGDFSPALTSPLAILMTLPNFIVLLLKHRHTKIKYLIIPFIILALVYFIASFTVDFISHPLQLTSRMQTDPGISAMPLGWVGSFLGITIVYHLMYLPLVLYELAAHDAVFLKRFGFWFSIAIFIILLYGLFQFVASGFQAVRVTSIMRLPTRLGPFIVVFLSFAAIELLEAKTAITRWYWVASLFLGIFLMFLTFTRIAIIAGVFTLILLIISLVSSKQYFVLKQLAKAATIGGLAFLALALVLHIDFFSRFHGDGVHSGHQARDMIVMDYQDGVNLENATPLIKTSHWLFGFGVFREREFAHFNLHNTVLCCLSVFGVVGLLLYYLPYFLILAVLLYHSLFEKNLILRPRYALAASCIVAFLVTGSYHNKLYSPIDTAYIWLVLGLIIQQQLPGLLASSQVLNAFSSTPHTKGAPSA
jgi:hypothetical protein